MSSFQVAWSVLTRQPVSGIVGDDPRPILAALPLAGGLIGAGACGVAALMIFATNGHPGAAGLICALLVPGLSWWVTRAAGLHGLIWTAERWALEINPEAGEGAKYAPYWAMLAFQVTILAKVVTIGLLVYMNSVLWLWVAPILSAAVYADTLKPPTAPNAPRRRWALSHWLIAGVIVLILGCLMRTLIAGLFVMVLAWLLTPKLIHLMQLRAGQLNDQERRTAMEVVEGAVLLLGVLSAAGVSPS
jgi:hypothetical protein